VRRAVATGGAAAAVVVLLAAGCAYFNTFYLARKYYAEAERTSAKSESDKLSPDAVKKYDDAIKQAGKVLAYHGRSGWVDDAVYLMGASYYGKKEYETALKKFDELLANYPDSDLVPWALYMSGRCHYERRSYEEMEASFRAVLEKKPKFEKRDEILYTEARAAETQRLRVDATRRYRELVRQFPRSPRAEEGLLRVGDLYFDAGDADSAYTSYLELTRVARADEVHRDALIKAADALIRLQRSEEAVRLLVDILPKEGSTAQGIDEGPPRAYIELAKAYNALEQHQQAIDALATVTRNYPSVTQAAEAQFQIGYTYEVYLDNPDSASKAYETASKMSSRSVFREQAGVRAKNLQQILSLSSQAKSDSATTEDKQAEATFKIAELLLFSQDRPLEALNKYREVEQQYPDSRLAARSAYAAAWIQLKKVEGARDSALVTFVRLVHQYPDTRQARGALEFLVAEKADTAGLTALAGEAAPETLAVAQPEATPPLMVSPPGEGEPGSDGSVRPDSLRRPVRVDSLLRSARAESLRVRAAQAESLGAAVRSRRSIVPFERDRFGPGLRDSARTFPDSIIRVRERIEP
jgi:TolA-binding protein